MSSFVPGMSDDDHAVPVNYDRLLPAELPYRFGNVLDGLVVAARIVFVWPDLIKPLLYDVQ